MVIKVKIAIRWGGRETDDEEKRKTQTTRTRRSQTENLKSGKLRAQNRTRMKRMIAARITSTKLTRKSKFPTCNENEK